MPLITPLYAGLIALLFVVLSARTIMGRRGYRISVGDGANEDMLKRMRTQANCAEYAPIGLLLLLMAELQGMPVWLVHVFGLMLLAGRVLHAWGFGQTPQTMWGRQAGMVLTLVMIILVALACVGYAVF
jgi:uncharacterized membrane protein YecN with MAPEG domain